MKIQTKVLEIDSHEKNEMINVTRIIEKMVSESNVFNGEVILFVPHTTAAITINENADPDVKRDMLKGLGDGFPENKEYRHLEGNTTAHIKSSVINVSQILLIENHKLLLGTWQGIYFCEFDGPRARKLYIRITGE